jgi:POT family proton-dependent oligopeptide transporter
MVTKLAPIRYQSMFMGIWFLASSAAYFLAGYAAAIFGGSNRVSLVFGDKGGLADFFLILAVFPMVFGFIALALVPKLKKMMHGIH